MNFLELILRWMHILPAVTLAGGLLFLHLAWLPGTAGMSDEEREESFAKFRAPWSRIVMVCTLLLLVSGLWNAVSLIKQYSFPSSPYHGLVLVKLLVAFALFFFAARIAGRSAKAVEFRKGLPKWLKVTTTLSLLLILTGGFMKSSERTPKDGKTSEVQADDSIE